MDPIQAVIQAATAFGASVNALEASTQADATNQAAVATAQAAVTTAQQTASASSADVTAKQGACYTAEQALIAACTAAGITAPAPIVAPPATAS
jgi:hypothetical protein